MRIEVLMRFGELIIWERVQVIVSIYNSSRTCKTFKVQLANQVDLASNGVVFRFWCIDAGIRQ